LQRADLRDGTLHRPHRKRRIAGLRYDERHRRQYDHRYHHGDDRLDNEHRFERDVELDRRRRHHEQHERDIGLDRRRRNCNQRQRRKRRTRHGRHERRRTRR
jgi:hypothetical protein